MEGLNFSFSGQELMALASGALWWPAEQTLVVSDLHLEKAASFARDGQFLPPYDTLDTLDTLEKLIGHFPAQRLVLLGDSFHDQQVLRDLHPDVKARLQDLDQRLSLVWIVGNHDPDLPPFLGGQVHSDFVLGGLNFRHQASPLFPQPGEVSGHFHPKACTKVQGRRVVRPIFALDHQRLILPAMGTFTGGLWLHTPQLYELFDPAQLRVLFCTRNKVTELPCSRLEPRR